MSRKKRPARLFFFAAMGIVVYFLLFPHPLGTEVVAKPAWVIAVPRSLPSTASMASPVVGADDGRSSAPFRLGGSFGFVSSGGDFLYVGSVLYQVSLSSERFVNYTRLGTDWILQGPNGVRLSRFSGNGYPLLSPNGKRIFNVMSDLSGVRELDADGETLWSRDFPGFVTSLAITDDRLAVGLVNGTLLLLDRQGLPVAEMKPTGSRISAIFANAVNPSGSLLAAIAGVDPQYLNVYRLSGTTHSEIAKMKLPSTFRREARMAFSPDGRYLAFEGEGRAWVFDPVKRSLGWLSAPGRLAGMAFSDQGRAIGLISRVGTEAVLSVTRPTVQSVVRATLAAKDIYLGGIDGQLLFGWDGMLMRIDVVEL